jgi:hypothetical protein
VDEDGDGRVDRIDAIEFDWWGTPPDAVHDDIATRRGGAWSPLGLEGASLAHVPRWAALQLRARHGLGSGTAERRVVARWHRVGTSGMFIRR